ncbi:dienelactone hydrolase [Arthrobacter sp. UYP6]|uniref:dienelactone hydrolase family protein n=1 Tax=Arthrobacter sp. UYP6 TaxID=1756378 RepID=UPI003396614B
MNTPVSAIGGYEDWPAYIRSDPGYSGHSPASAKLAAILGVPAPSPSLPETTVRSVRVVDGIRITELRWQLPYGPPSTGYLAEPAGTEGPLPGVLWLQCHAGNKWLGSERIVDLGSEATPEAASLRENLYEGLAPVNELAKAGFAVLTHDAFSWGSRRFTLVPAPQRTARVLEARHAAWAADGTVPTAAMVYDAAAADHENTIAKAAGMLGTSYAGMVALEDLTALAILRNRPGVDATRIGTGGFSGGGGRALLLSALDPDLKACVVACMMTTIGALFPSHLDYHSWLMNTPGLAAEFDWPELAALAPATAFLVQYAAADQLFPLAGMQEADAGLQRILIASGRYQAQWHDGGHVFDRELLARAREHLLAVLQPPKTLNPTLDPILPQGEEAPTETAFSHTL